MNQTDFKRGIGCLTTLLVALLALTFLTTSSLNILNVYRSDSVWAKIVVSILAVFASLGLLQLFGLVMMRTTIRLSTKMPAVNVICPGCHQPLLAYSGAYGSPISCPICRKWWHRGALCYRKGREGMRIGCPDHYPSTVDNRDLFEDIE